MHILVDDLFDEEDWMRGPNIGRELVQMTRSKKGKLPLVIEPGKKRPNPVMVAAKFATECNIAVRNTIPIFPHCKDYKKHPKMILAYISRVGVSVQTCLFPLFVSNTNIVHSITIGSVVYCY
jgi:hypothetical protein